MPAGVEEPAYSSIRSPIRNDCDSPLAALGNGEVILSKSSLSWQDFAGQEYADPSSLIDYFGGAVSAACVRSRISASYLGEPATPNGAGDCATSYSPVSIDPRLPCRGFCYGQPSMGLRGENSPESSNLGRRSCSFESEELSPYSGHSTPMPALRNSRFLSGIGYAGAATASALSATTVLGASAPYHDTFATATGAHAQRLEQELREQCAENQRLRQQVRDRDEQLCALRVELIRLRQSSPLSERPTSAAQGDDMQDLLSQLLRAREKLTSSACGSHPEPALSNERDDALLLVASVPGQAPAPLGRAGRDEAPEDPSLVRVDTPPHGHEALLTARSLSGEIVAVLPPAENQRHAEIPSAPLQCECLQRTEMTAQPGGSIGASTRQGAEERMSSAFSGAASQEVNCSGGSPALHPLLMAERRRTDRAHAALLFSSRQAQRLAEQLAEVEVHAAALREELRDWRRACIDNHKELCKHRRAAAAAAAAADVAVATVTATPTPTATEG